MIAPKDTFEAESTAALPNSRKVYVAGQLHSEIRIPFREISLAPTKTMSGEIEVNEPVRVYDTSGPWGDADQHVDVTEGLPALRAKWVRDRGDVEEIVGREVTPIDDGYLSEKHAASAAQKRPRHGGQAVPNPPKDGLAVASVQHPTSNGSNGNGIFPVSGFRFPVWPGGHFALPPATPSHSFGTLAKASSRPRWSSLPFAKT